MNGRDPNTYSHGEAISRRVKDSKTCESSVTYIQCHVANPLRNMIAGNLDSDIVESVELDVTTG